MNYKNQLVILLQHEPSVFTTFIIKMSTLIEQGRTLMHCRSTTFIYHNDFTKYMKVERVTLEDVLDYLFDVRVRKFLSKKERNIFMNYLKNEKQCIFNLMKILMIIQIMKYQKTLLEMKENIILLWMPSLVRIKYSKKLLLHYFCQV